MPISLVIIITKRKKKHIPLLCSYVCNCLCQITENIPINFVTSHSYSMKQENEWKWKKKKGVTKELILTEQDINVLISCLYSGYAQLWCHCQCVLWNVLYYYYSFSVLFCFIFSFSSLSAWSPIRLYVWVWELECFLCEKGRAGEGGERRGGGRRENNELHYTFSVK